jgi:Ion channel
MKLHPEKLFLGRPHDGDIPSQGSISRRLHNIRAIWNNEFDNDNGIEKVLRLFLAVSQFFFPGLYYKQIFSKKWIAYQDLAVDVYVLFKLSFPFFLLINGLQYNHILFFILILFMVETMLYVPTLIFASDVIARPRSYRRSMLLLFINYTEIIFDFGVIYAHGNYLNTPFVHWFDPIYFSFITSATIGYGDFYPVVPAGKFLVSFQSTLFIIFVALFLNFFSGKVESKGYFGQFTKQD